MSSIFDFDITGRIAKLGGNILGDAHEHYVTAILIRLGFDVAISQSPSPYDLLITAYENRVNSTTQIIKARIRNCAKRINFTANSNEKNDLIIGVDKNTLEIYLVPAVFLKHLGNSKSLTQLECLKNNWNILLNWREAYLSTLLQKIIR